MKKGYWVVAYRSISDESAVKAYAASVEFDNQSSLLQSNFVGLNLTCGAGQKAPAE